MGGSMKKNKLVPIILVSLSCVLFIVAIVLVLNTNYFSFNNKTNNKETSDNQIKEENVNNDNTQVEDKKEEVNQEQTTNDNKNETVKEENKDKEEIVDNDTPTTNQNNTVSTPTPKPTPTVTSTPTPTPTQTLVPTKTPAPTPTPKEEDVNVNQEVEEPTKNEETIISYFSLQDNSITSDGNQDDRTFREKAKDAFVTVIDFIFYDKEIKGYTFKGLTNSAKLKIIKIALSIDNKIDEYFPDYKDVIKDKYTNIKGKLAVKYLEFTSFLCEKVGEDTCNQAKEDFNNMKESFGFTWQLIKELASSGSNKVKEFYESWRDSE